MPKIDTVRRIDNRTNGSGKAHASPAGAIYSGDGMADTLDGYDASKTPGPNLIPVSRADGTLDPAWLPEQMMSGEGASPIGGQVYVAPWVRLAKAISGTDATLLVTGPAFAVGDHGILAHYLYGNEAITVTGGPVQVGGLYEYTVERASLPRAYPAGTTTVFNLGGADGGGGFITLVSGDQQMSLNPPHINLWAYENGTAVRKARLGLLSGLSAGEKALFPDVDDWNRYSLYADDAFLKGQINATSGNITGDLDVSGTLSVWSGLGRAGVVMGESEGGHGIVLQNKEGRPVFAAISPYEDTDGTLNEVALYIEHEGEKGLYYHKNALTGEYQLDIAVNTLVDGTLRATNILAGTGTYPNAFTGMRFGAGGLQSYGTDFLPQVELDVQDGRLYFGGREGWLDRDGMVIDTRQLAQGTDALDHTIRWIRQTNMIESGWRVGAAIGSEADALFATSRTYYGDLGIPNADPNQFYQAQLWLQAGPNDTTYLTAPNVEIRGDTSSALTVGRLNPVRAALDGAGRFSAPRLTVGGNMLHVTDDGATVAIGSNTATGAKVISESDTMAQFRGQRSDGQYVALTAAANAEAWVSASGSLVLAPAAGQTGQKYVLPSADQTIALGSQARKFSAVYAQNGHFGALGSQTSLAGQFYLTKRRATLAVGLEADNTTVYVFEDDLLEGEFYRFEDVDGNWEVIRINTVGIPTGDGWYEHEVERQQGADVDNSLGLARLWDAGAVGVSLGGNAQDGYIRLFGADDQNPNTGPAIVVMQRDNDDDPNSVSERAVFGNLNGFYGYGENKYGVAFGTHAGRWVSLDEAEGLRIMEVDQQQAVYREYVQIGRPDGNNVFITDSSLALRTGTTAYIEMDNAGNLDLTGTLAVATGGAITWAGGKGRADDTGLAYNFDANSYWHASQYPSHALLIITTEVSDGESVEHALDVSVSGSYQGSALHAHAVGGSSALHAESVNGYGALITSDTSYGLVAQANAGQDKTGVAIWAKVQGNPGTAILIENGVVNGGSQRYTNLANATAATDALNRQTGDLRYGRRWRHWMEAA